MNLEDHVGDIIRKARAMAGKSVAATADAAGITQNELALLESSGIIPKDFHIINLAIMLGLSPQKLAGVAGGWQPSAVDLRRWGGLRIFTTRDTNLSVNCFLVWDPASSGAALFDTGLDGSPVLDHLTSAGLELRHVFITHSHWDHIEALPQIRAAFPLAQIHSGSARAPDSQRNQPGQIISLGNLRITYRATPGHAVDGVTYLVDNWSNFAPMVAMVGDAIFAGSIGRGNDSWDLARQKVREEILSLPTETLICPGHGPLTTVREEIACNPFF